MTIDQKFISQFLNVTSQAALASYNFVGKKDKIGADKAAVDSMRNELNKLDIKGQIVIGEGELDQAPMLYIGEKVGTINGPEIDIAVDPLEGTNFAANNLPGALSVIAVAEKNNLFNAPETYMEKISAKVRERKVIDLDYSVKKNIFNLSEYLNKKPENITACIMDRPRHKNIINELKILKVNIKLITDGDVSGALLVTDDKYDVDIFLGIGGGPEGVLASAALDTFNCTFQGRFLFDTETDKRRAIKMGINNLTKKYELDEIIKGDSIFCATGITSGDLVSGIKIENNEFISETLVTHKSTGLKKIIKKVVNR
ncbi:class II fructose-bisphosphatase [Candidatus Pelagibacter sp.]|nr:class II fructose-bisphosphatase [Candidatus Pelagibacter sp.]|tara:strand:+ start:720 stop:1661 length:942 start_codon:yes stop_codon:yes gene_type:complete